MTAMQTRPAPQDRRPRATKGAASRKQRRTDAALEHGLALTDSDGTRLQVRIRDVKGIHDARLVEATGLDFMGLLEAMTRRKGLDLFAAALWFARLVNGREGQAYTEVLEEFGYEDFALLDVDEPKDADDAPKASASKS